MTNAAGDLEYTPEDLALVTGASGTIGPSLVQRLLDLGLKVRAFSRNPESYDDIKDQIEVFQGDVRDINALRSAMVGVRTVFHLAAKLHIYNPTDKDKADYHEVNVEGVRNVVLSAKEANVSRLVYFSTINVYGPGESGVVFTEKSPLRPGTVYSKSKAEGEDIVIDELFSGEGESRGVILRLAAVYGPEMKGNYLLLLKGLKERWFIPIGKGANRRTMINIQDVVSGAVLAAFHPRAAGQIFNLTDGRIYSLNQIIEVMCAVLNRQAPLIHLPQAPVRLIVGLIEDTLNLFNVKSPLNRKLVNTILEERAVSGDLIQDELNFSPAVSLEAGWLEIAKSLGMVNHKQV